MKTGYRIHICPVGFENDRVCEPLLDPKADKAYLITRGGADDLAASYIDEIKKFLKKHNIAAETRYCDISNLTNVLGLYGEIFQDEKGNSIFVNVSTGSKIMAIAGMMACMMWDGDPYYAIPKEYTGQQMTIGVEKTITLPHYPINKPSEAIIECITFIDTKGANGASKKSIIQYLRTKELLNIQSEEKEGRKVKQDNQEAKDSKPTQAEYKALEERILRPAREEWKYTLETGKGKSRRITVTEAGKAAIRIFGGKK